MSNIAIKVQNLSKVYKLYDKPIDRLKESLHPFKKKYHKDFYALNDVSFEIKKGETVGIIGKNGAGKSTLLKIITGVLTPSSGHVHVNGRIASLLELGAGFNPEYTGVENIYLQGTLMGYTHEEMESKIQAILDFADIGDFVYQPVKSYSSGMFARLAFSVAINVDPDILIVDEALSVGDMKFQQKCYRKFREFQESNKTILFVTHDTGTIINYCTHTIWINDGKKVDEGLPEDVCKRYMSAMAYEQFSAIEERPKIDLEAKDDDIWHNLDEVESFGEKKILITGISMIEENNPTNQIFKGGENIILKIKMFSTEDFEHLISGFIVNDHLGNAIFGANTYVYKNVQLNFEKNQEYIVEYNFELPYLRNGMFSISPAIAEGTQTEHIQHHWIHDAMTFTVNTTDKKAQMGWLFSIDKINIKLN
ncbi:ABC transporter ATP-binding protein [Aliarcobacter cryaerophilus]|uniref:ABC transporter ATP-binding protein n=1 Tax=Aliarcobacter cryaerophilus TaxID=28198 RepID=UPI0021B1E661|nr:ABC transporter ATP-binding protein [Aliarcobacter cryaerophilus]MCT7433166.1 ABC transporter ATP-binding protein [Aliarcobacter cryaerophilus]